MSLLTDVQTAVTTFIAKVAELVAQTGSLVSVITGPSGGAGSLVNVGPRTLKTVARVLAEVENTRGWQMQGPWNAGTTYAELDVVSYLSKVWVSLAGSNLNNAPSDVSAFWVVLYEPLAISVVDYGAVGDDSTSNTVAIQAALDSGLPEIYLPLGTFRCGTIDIPNTLRRLYGPGIIKNTVAADVSGLRFNGFQSDATCVIDGITFDGVLEAGANAIIFINDVIGCKNVTIRGCRFIKGGSSIALFTTGVGIFDQIRIEDNEFVDQTNPCIHAFSNTITEHLIVSRNRMLNCSGTAMKFDGSATTNHKKIVVEHNIVHGCAAIGLDLQNGVGGRVVGNSFIDNNLDAIECGANGLFGVSDGMLIADNLIFTATATDDLGIGVGAIDGATVRNTSILNNAIINQGNFGIYVHVGGASLVEKVVVSGNYILNCSQHNPFPGIALGQFSGSGGIIRHCSVVGNTITDTDGNMNGGISEDATGTNNHFHNNVISSDNPHYLLEGVINTFTPPSLVPVEKTTDFSVDSIGYSYICNGAGAITVGLPDPTQNDGRALIFKTIAAQTVASALSNVAPLNSNTSGTAILAATAGKWAKMVADAANSKWVIQEAN